MICADCGYTFPRSPGTGTFRDYHVSCDCCDFTLTYCSICYFGKNHYQSKTVEPSDSIKTCEACLRDKKIDGILG